MAIEIVVAQAHKGQLDDKEIKREYESIKKAFKSIDFEYKSDTVNFVFINGIYNNFEKKMTTACVFVNKTDKPIKELHGELRLHFNDINALIAKTTINFDEEFMGAINADEGLLVHLNIPVKGLTEDMDFSIDDISGNFDGVRVTFNL